MNRDQAKAIIENIDLIRHFAEGGEIGFRAFNCCGEPIAIWPSKSIILSNMFPGHHCLYVKVKAKMVWNSKLECYEHAPRHWPTKITEAEIIDCVTGGTGGWRNVE
jgi:hypothetical protein